MEIEKINSKSTSVANSSVRKVPELKLSDYISGDLNLRTKFINDFWIGLKDYGFVVLKDHTISNTLLNEAYDLAKALFDLPLEKKLSYRSKLAGGQRGYTAFGEEHAKDSPVSDLKEFWHVGRELALGSKWKNEFPENIWPTEFSRFKEVFVKIFSELDRTGQIMMEALTYPLEVPKDYFFNLSAEGNTILRLLHYPPIPKDADPRSIRAAAHEDINLITILVSATSSGLQLKDRDGKWLDIESDPNSLIVDAGDMLARITNDVIPSTTHRVVNPEDAKSSRYSMPFFIHPNMDAMLECIPSCRGSGEKYAPILGQDFLMQRLREIGLMK